MRVKNVISRQEFPHVMCIMSFWLTAAFNVMRTTTTAKVLSLKHVLNLQ